MGEDNALGAIDEISRLRGYAVILPSVAQELGDQARNQQDEALRGIAQKALSQLTNWGIHDPPLETKQHAVADIVAKKLVQKGFCHNYQSALILAEAAVYGCRLLLTYDHNLCQINMASLRLFLLEADVCDTFVLPPHWFVHFFQQKNSAASESASPPAVP